MTNPLESARLILKPVSECDNILLHRWRNDPDYLKMVATRRTVISLDKFITEQKRAFEHERHLQFIVCQNQVGYNAVGTIFSFNFNLTDGHTFINLFIERGFRNLGYGPEAGVLFVCYLFDFFPLHKIYFEAFGYNDPSLSMLQTAGLVEEGVFKDHRFFGGKRYDVIRFAIYRNSLDRVRGLHTRFCNRNRRP